ncbi:hypothetical protein B0H10DRAFT_1769313, partial [Mycena sp. CBHHK59/15]
FSYTSIADYRTSSYNYTVVLFTSPPSASAPSESFGAGHFFGRFAEPNYPGQIKGIPTPTTPIVTLLVMPNFSANPGGFGAGATAENATFYLVVFEEYSNGAISI